MIRRIGQFEIFYAGPNPGDLVVRPDVGEPFVIETYGMTMEMVEELIAHPFSERERQDMFVDEFDADADGGWKWRPLTAHERIALERSLAEMRERADG